MKKSTEIAKEQFPNGLCIENHGPKQLTNGIASLIRVNCHGHDFTDLLSLEKGKRLLKDGSISIRSGGGPEMDVRKVREFILSNKKCMDFINFWAPHNVEARELEFSTGKEKETAPTTARRV